jgi:hypothetical protein
LLYYQDNTSNLKNARQKKAKPIKLHEIAQWKGVEQPPTICPPKITFDVAHRRCPIVAQDKSDFSDGAFLNQ